MDTEKVENNDMDDFQLVGNHKKTPKPQRVIKKHKKPLKKEIIVEVKTVVTKVNKQLTKQNIFHDFYFPKSGSRFEALTIEN